ncbi:uncharacterized protein LODBEIA_P43950 [Lodderomyces beijingensis]|uniref:Uncharacterized protein n=1 Tax=Lodderomyces beijingensis TaxID=1775926 RepID=A0ABP0ZT75_9ASCO
MLRQRVPIVLSRMISYGHNPPPPSHFSNPNEPPPSTYGPNSSTGHNSLSSQNLPQYQNQYTPATPPDSSLPQTSQSPLQSQPQSQSRRTQNAHEGSIREITSLLAMLALAYIAIDNYLERMKLEKLHNETTAINLKALQVQQLNYQKERKKRDLQSLQERRDIAKRSFKMALHIAMLRKQLSDAGVDPVSMDQAVAEFERSVKADNSIKNVTGQYLWLDDNSDFKPYIPDSMEYDKMKKSN